MRMMLFAVSITSLTLMASALGQEATPEDNVAKSLEQISGEVQKVLAKERVHSMFDYYRRMSEFGVTFQPSLVAPTDLAPKLGRDQLRLYAGVKLFDAIYAATFMKRQEVAESVRAIEDAQRALDLRSYADITGLFLITLKRAAASPESVDVQTLIANISDDYVNEAPSLMADPESAEYLIDGLYGYMVQFSYVMSELIKADPQRAIVEGFSRIDGGVDRLHLMIELFEAFDRLDDEIRTETATVQKLAFIRKCEALVRGLREGSFSRDEARPRWREMSEEVKAIRVSILGPSVW